MANANRRREQRTPRPAARPAPLPVKERVPVSARLNALKGKAGKWVRRHWILIALVAVAALLRFGWLGHHDLWVDELNTYYDAVNLEHRNPLTRYHWLSFWMYRTALSIHDSPYVLRIPSALTGVLVLIPFYLLVRQRLKKPEALLLTALLAFMPYNIQYSMEARYYSHVFFFSTLALCFLAKFCLHASLTSLILFFVAQGGAVLCHPASGSTAAGTTLAILVWIALNPRRWWKLARARFDCFEKRWGSLVARTVLGLQLLVLLVIAVGSAYAAYRLIIRPTILQWDQPPPKNVSFSYSFFQSHFTRYARGRWSVSPIPTGKIGAVVALFGLGMAWWRRRFFAVLATCAYLGGLGLLFLSRAEIAYIPKYSTALAPALLLLIGIGLLELGRLLSRLIRHGTPFAYGAGLSVGLILLWMPSMYFHYTGQFMPVQKAMRHVQAHSDGSVRPLIMVQGLSDFDMEYYRQSTLPGLLRVNVFTGSWPWDALGGFIASTARSDIPVWAAVFRTDLKTGCDPHRFGRWSEPIVFESLYDNYDLLLYRSIGAEDEPPAKPVPGLSSARRYEAEDFRNITPRWAGVVGDGEKRALVAVSTVTTEYDVGGVGSPYAQISLVGRNVAKHPRLVEVRIDNEPVGVVYFPQEQDQPTTKSILARPPAEGNFLLSLSVLDSTMPVNYAGTFDKDRLELYSFEIRPIDPERLQSQVVADSLLLGQTFTQLPKGFDPSKFTEPANPKDKSRSWSVFPSDSKWSVHEDPETGKEVLCLHVQKTTPGGAIVSPAFPTKKGEMVYGSLEVKTEGLNTHSANVRVEFVDKGGASAGIVFATNRSIHGDTPWQRLTFFTSPTDKAVAFRILVDFWRAERPSRLTGGRLCIRDFRMEWPPQVRSASADQ